MQIQVFNSHIEISGYSSDMKKRLHTMLAYTDTSKQYQVRKMEKNPYTRNSAFMLKLKSEINGCLLVEKDNTLFVPSGFAHVFTDFPTNDHRKDTGPTIALPWKKKPFDLRPYQQEAIDMMADNYRGLINMATGLGKTLTALYAIKHFKKKTLLVCPSQNIAENFYQELSDAFGSDRVGFFGGGKKKTADITIGIAQSVKNHIDKFKALDLGLIIIDEVHHLAAETFYTITDALSNTGRIFGLTATDFRSDGKDVFITAGVGKVLIKKDLIWGIQNNWLAQPKFIIRQIPTIGRDFKDDKNKSYKEHVLNSDVLNQQLISDIQRCLAAGKAVLCLVDEKQHGEMISQKVGLPLACGDNKESRNLVLALNNHKLPGLIGTDSLIGEGTDTKNVDVLVLANFVASRGPLWQNLGRGLRRQGTKTHVLVLDYHPMGSTMLSRHASQRLSIYKEITDNIEII